MIRAAALVLAAVAAVPAFAASERDERLAQLVRDVFLRHHAAAAADAEVEAADGVVTLRGETVGEAQRAEAAAYAREVPGVREVENQMTVAGTQVSVSTALDGMDDAAATLRVKAALAFRGPAGARKIRVHTRDGVVILKGAVADQAVKERAVRLVREMDGVGAVDDRLTVAR